jgi:hypothetical protein
LKYDSAQQPAALILRRDLTHGPVVDLHLVKILDASLKSPPANAGSDDRFEDVNSPSSTAGWTFLISVHDTIRHALMSTTASNVRLPAVQNDGERLPRSLRGV